MKIRKRTKQPNKPVSIEDLRLSLLELREYEISLLRTASGEYSRYLTGRIEILNYIFDKMGWKK